jgi:hypothetical protein
MLPRWPAQHDCVAAHSNVARGGQLPLLVMEPLLQQQQPHSLMSTRVE